MIFKSADIDGSLLDWAVANCEFAVGWDGHELASLVTEDESPFIPTSDWSQGGPIIHRECIQIKEDGHGFWLARHDTDDWVRGATPLIAAMRCHIASMLGDEIEVPDDIASSLGDEVESPVASRFRNKRGFRKGP